MIPTKLGHQMTLQGDRREKGEDMGRQRDEGTVASSVQAIRLKESDGELQQQHSAYQHS